MNVSKKLKNIFESKKNKKNFASSPAKVEPPDERQLETVPTLSKRLSKDPKKLKMKKDKK